MVLRLAQGGGEGKFIGFLLLSFPTLSGLWIGGRADCFATMLPRPLSAIGSKMLSERGMLVLLSTIDGLSVPDALLEGGGRGR